MKIIILWFLVLLFSFIAAGEDKATRDNLMDIHGAQHATMSSYNEKRMRKEREWVTQFQQISDNLKSIENKRSESLITFHFELRQLQVDLNSKLKEFEEKKQKITSEADLQLAAIESASKDPKITPEKISILEFKKKHLLDTKKKDLAELKFKQNEFNKNYKQKDIELRKKHQSEMDKMDRDFVAALKAATNLSNQIESNASQALSSIRAEREKKESVFPDQIAKALGIEEEKKIFSDFVREAGDPILRTGKGPTALLPNSNSPLNVDVTKFIYHIVLDGKILLPNLDENIRFYKAVDKVKELHKYEPSITLKVVDKKPQLVFDGNKPFRLEFFDKKNPNINLRETDRETEHYLQKRFLANLLETYDSENLIEFDGQRLFFHVVLVEKEKESNLPKEDPRTARISGYVQALQKSNSDQIRDFQSKYQLMYTKNFNLADKDGEYKIRWFFIDAKGVGEYFSDKINTEIEERWQAQLLKTFTPPYKPQEVVASIEEKYVPPVKQELAPLPQKNYAGGIRSRTIEKDECKGYFRFTLDEDTLLVDMLKEDIWVPIFNISRFLDEDQLSCADKNTVAVIGTRLARFGELKFELMKDGDYNADVIEDENSLTSRDKEKTALFLIKDKKVIRALSSNRKQFERVVYEKSKDNKSSEFRAVPGRRDKTENKVYEWSQDGSLLISPNGKSVKPIGQ